LEREKEEENGGRGGASGLAPRSIPYICSCEQPTVWPHVKGGSLPYDGIKRVHGCRCLGAGVRSHLTQVRKGEGASVPATRGWRPSDSAGEGQRRIAVDAPSGYGLPPRTRQSRSTQLVPERVAVLTGSATPGCRPRHASRTLLLDWHCITANGRRGTPGSRPRPPRSRHNNPPCPTAVIWYANSSRQIGRGRREPGIAHLGACVVRNPSPASARRHDGGSSGDPS